MFEHIRVKNHFNVKSVVEHLLIDRISAHICKHIRILKNTGVTIVQKHFHVCHYLTNIRKTVYSNNNNMQRRIRRLMIVPVHQCLCLLHFRFDIFFKYLASILSCCCVPYSSLLYFQLLCIYLTNWPSQTFFCHTISLFFLFTLKRSLSTEEYLLFISSKLLYERNQWYEFQLFNILSSFFTHFSWSPMLHLNERSSRKWTLGSCGANSIPVLFSALIFLSYISVWSTFVCTTVGTTMDCARRTHTRTKKRNFRLGELPAVRQFYLLHLLLQLLLILYFDQ